MKTENIQESVPVEPDQASSDPAQSCPAGMVVKWDVSDLEAVARDLVDEGVWVAAFQEEKWEIKTPDICEVPVDSINLGEDSG